MNSRENLPMMLSANDIQTMGFTRTMAYNILVADERYPFASECVDDVQQVFRGASQTADTLDVERVTLTHIVKHSPELRAVCVCS